MQDDFLKIYNAELANLRKDAQGFANEHPKIASRLKLGQGGTDDPLAGRLFEGLAFLTARTLYDMQAETQTLEENLIKQLDPLAFLPIPSCSVMQFHPSEQLTEPYSLEAKTPVGTFISGEQNFSFTTCYPVTIRPIHLSKISYRREDTSSPVSLLAQKKDFKSCLRLTVSTNNKTSLSSLALDSLRFFINADAPYAGQLYELFMTRIKVITLRITADHKTIDLPVNSIAPVGFMASEGLLPTPSVTILGSRLLTDYFAFPEKFLFFDLKGLDGYLKETSGDTVQLYFYFDCYYSALDKQVDDQTLLLHCTPIINLFEHDPKPISFILSESSYHLEVNPRYEVYQLASISVTGGEEQHDIHCAQITSTFHTPRKQHYLHWDALRKSCETVGEWKVKGHETYLIIKEHHLEGLSGQLFLNPHLLCTNRNIANELSKHEDKLQWVFKNEAHELISNMNCVRPITSQQYRRLSSMGGMEIMRHLCTHQIAYHDNAQTLAAIQSVLSIYNFGQPTYEKLRLSGIISARANPTYIRNPQLLRQGFSRCIELWIKVDEECFPANDIYLFGCVLNEYLAKDFSSNNLYKLTISSLQYEELFQWSIKPGSSPTI